MNLLNDPIIHALCRTFAHSLWQGLLLAILTGAVVQLTRKKTAAFRYNLLSLLLLGFMVTAVTTFFIETQNYEASAVNTEGSGLSVADKVDYTTGNIAPLAAEIRSFISGIQQVTNSFLHNYAGLIVGVWLLIFCYKCVATINGLRHVHRIRNYRTSSPGEYWEMNVASMQQLLKIPFKVKLFESKLVDIPAVAGFFKPVILLPIGMLNNLPQEQVEAILLHELAHIRRADYLVNILQRFVETLFFFNPAVLWLSSIIKDERENCCDDIAVGVTGNKKDFVEALVSFQEYRQSAATYSLGLSNGSGNRKTKLLDRSKRLLYSSNRSLNTIEKSAISVCILLLTMISFAFSGKQAPETVTKRSFTGEITKREHTFNSTSVTSQRVNSFDPENYWQTLNNCKPQPNWPLKDTISVHRKVIELTKKTQKLSENKSTTTIITTITTTTVTDNAVTCRAIPDSAVVLSCLKNISDTLRTPLLTAFAPVSGIQTSIISYPQNSGEITACKK